jgi:hypothetical protein
MRRLLPLALLLAGLCAAQAQAPVQPSPAERDRIARQVWQNECGGTVDGLTSWNDGEEFPSLGIGHFIWYVEGREQRFDESFPKVVAFLASKGVKLPEVVLKNRHCPWPDQKAFMKDFKSPQMTELRAFLKDTVELQAEFVALRLQEALPKILGHAPAAERASLTEKFYAVAAAPNGLYALIDYVNFKGEGIKESERYKGEGWGMLQVLEAMPAGLKGGDAVCAFARAGYGRLALRVKNAPPERGEARWLPGWKNRLRTYCPGLE